MDAQIPTGTDPLADLLNGVRTTGAVFNRSSLSGSWAVRFEDGSPLALAVPLRGPAWVTPQGRRPVRLDPGDVAVLSGRAPYVIAGDPATEPERVIRSDGRCTIPGGQEQSAARHTSLQDEPGPGGTVLLNGFYTVEAGTPGRLLAVLPPLAVVPAGQGSCPVNPAAFEEFTCPAPGQQVLLDRTLDLMLITALRAWFTRPGAEVPAWYRAHSDPVVGHALRLLDAYLAHPWTVEILAAKTGVSRAALARNFTALVGQPPMTYLREQRLALAANLLREPGATLGAVASRVGFSSAFALSAAFKKVCGVSPSEHRTGRAR
ncbi:AraC-type DNA-binding domain-containing protein- like protein [Streptomyces bingchenggensis BCW-1]|uniref:AraC-type DNA-binding domain-containing protein-like protein n=1 Tax=Streptomyces bingchenggensis (strain BCW-1) TaxID=749414 RepID=D7C892_STRBB|nr:MULTISPECIES: AraC family transcriptional regulator [Streptomyces]ADI04253.1 AraC-type DNA-binding domain-containing protein- like protein [Streptomyces bingchenggensis BCW-1]